MSFERLLSKTWTGYAIAVFGTILAAAVRTGLGKMVGEGIPPFILFYPVVMASAVCGGTGAGLAATFLSAALVDYIFLLPYGFGIDRPGDIAGQILFVIVNAMISIAGGKLRASRLQLQRDIAERRESEEALRIASAKLEQLNNDLSQWNEQLERIVQIRTAELRQTIVELEQFSYSITHDMRAPLRGMRGYISLLLNQSPERFGPEAEGYLAKISEAAERMDNLIVESLNYAQALRGELSLAVVDAGMLLRGLLQSYPAFQLPSADIQIEGTIPPILANQAGLTQCFSTLLNNAVKDTAPDQVPIVRIRAETSGSIVRIWFADNGTGFPKESQSRIFHLFQHLNEGIPDTGDTGIGLAVAYKLVGRMRGKIGVESEPGRGSQFWVEFPSAPNDSKPATSIST